MKKVNPEHTALIGIGNSGRRDDGLGWALVERLADLPIGLNTFFRYQLNIEDAELIAHYGTVIFVDACHHSEQCDSGFSFKKISAQKDFSFTSHSLAPATILYLCDALYQKLPNCYLLAIQGNEWGLEVGISKIAEKNLDAAYDFLKKKLSQGIGLPPKLLPEFSEKKP